MLVSFIIPAHNEEAVLVDTLDRLFLSASDCLNAGSYEVIVVDDASSDQTAELARQMGARVVSVQLRQIAAARNAGAKAAGGQILVFVDADTLVPEITLQSALHRLQQGAIGGGATVQFDAEVPFLAKMATAFLMRVFIHMHLAAGCFIFCTREAFQEVGGFDERFFASEEIWLSNALKQQGRFEIVSEPVITSGRKIRMHGLLGLLWQSVRIILRGTGGVQRREGLELWYDGRREPSIHGLESSKNR